MLKFGHLWGGLLGFSLHTVAPVCSLLNPEAQSLIQEPRPEKFALNCNGSRMNPTPKNCGLWVFGVVGFGFGARVCFGVLD